jgi:hypothetical protein
MMTLSFRRGFVHTWAWAFGSVKSCGAFMTGSYSATQSPDVQTRLRDLPIGLVVLMGHDSQHRPRTPVAGIDTVLRPEAQMRNS